MNTNCAIEKRSGENVRISGRPLDVERPVVGSGQLVLASVHSEVTRRRLAYLSNQLRSLRIPDESAVILAT